MRQRSRGVLAFAGQPAGFLGLILAVCLVVRIPSFVVQLFDPDEAVIANQAITLQHGGRLYLDAIDRKPPIPAWIYEGVFALTGGTDLRWLHLVAAVLLALAAYAVSRDPSLSTRIERRWAAGLLITGAVAFLPTNAQAANFAHFALAPGAAAMVLARRRGVASAVAGGVCLALAVGCRQTWLVGIPAAAFSMWRCGEPRRIMPYGAGFVVAVGGIVWASGDPRGLLHWVVLGNGGFVSSLPSAAGLLTALTMNVLVQVILLHAVLWLLAARRFKDRSGDLDLWFWVAGGLLAYVTGWRFFGHYFLQTLPPLCILAAPVAARLRSKLVPATLALTGVVVWALAFTPQAVRSYPDPTRAAAYVRAHTTPGERVLIWGNFPELQWQADRPIAGGFVHSDFVTGLTGYRDPSPTTLATVDSAITRHFLASLRAHPPALIVDTATVRAADTKDVRGVGLRGYGAYPMSVIPGFRNWVDQHYARAAVVDGLTMYRWKGGVPAEQG